MSQQTSGRRMKIGFSPAIHGGAGSGQMPRFRDLQAQARAAEQIGLDSLWVADHVVWPFPNQKEQHNELTAYLSELERRAALAP